MVNGILFLDKYATLNGKHPEELFLIPLYSPFVDELLEKNRKKYLYGTQLLLILYEIIHIC